MSSETFQRYAHDKALGSTGRPVDPNPPAAPEQHTIRHKLRGRLADVRDTLRAARENQTLEDECSK